jgi:hypothetical protein
MRTRRTRTRIMAGERHEVVITVHIVALTTVVMMVLVMMVGRRIVVI